MPRPPQTIGFVSAASVVVASMVGAGVYTTSGFALADLGSPGRVLAAWLVGGIVALCGAISYGSLAGRFAESGGEYTYWYRAVHPLAGCVSGWVSLLAGFTGAIAFAAVTLEAYLAPAETRPDWLPPGAIALGAIALGAALHAVRVRPGATMQNGIVALKLLLLALFAGWGWMYMLASSNASLPGPEAVALVEPFSVAAFASSLVWISLSYSGFNGAIYIAGEVEDGRRVVPRALVWATFVVTLLYLALNAVFLYVPPAGDVAGRADVGRVAARALGGPPLEYALTMLIALSLFTSITAMLMSGPRVYARMADDGLLPAWLQFRGPVPRSAILFQAVAAGLVVAMSDLRELLSYLGFTLSVSAALTVATIFWIRRREGPEAIRVPWFPAPPLLFIVATLTFAAISVRQNPWEAVAGGVTLLFGAAAFFIARIRPGR